MRKTLRNLIVALLICSLLLPMTVFASNTYDITVSIEDSQKPSVSLSHKLTSQAGSSNMMATLAQVVGYYYTATNKANKTGMYQFASPAMQKIMNYGLSIYSDAAKWKTYVDNDPIQISDGETLDVARHYAKNGTKNDSLKTSLFDINSKTIADYGVGTYVITLLNNVTGDDKYGITYTVTIVIKEHTVSGGGSSSSGGTTTPTTPTEQTTPTTPTESTTTSTVQVTETIEMKNVISTTTNTATGATEATVSGGNVEVTTAVKTETAADGTVKETKVATVSAAPAEQKIVNYVVVRNKETGEKIELTYDGEGNFTFDVPEEEVVIETTFRTAPATLEETGVSELLDTSDHALYMIGDTAGNFRPKSDINRAEVATIFYRLLKNRDVETTTSFSDFSENDWYSTAVNTLASIGIVNGRTETTFAPLSSITRAEFATICARFAKSIVTGTTFVDTNGHWAEDYISTAASYGWIYGYGNDDFQPDEPISREEAAAIVNRMLYRLGDQIAIDKETATHFPDVDDTMWSWYEIGEATNGHDFTDEEAFVHEYWSSENSILHSDR